MDKDALAALLFFIILFLIQSKLSTAADPIYTDCPNGPSTKNYSLKTPFENNLRLILQNLTSRTPLTGFYNTSMGNNPDRVHGQALCRGDTDAKTCQSCIDTASRQLLETCKSVNAIIWYESCQVRYSIQSFFSMQVYTGKYVEWETQGKNISNPDHFNKILTYLMRNITSEAAYNSSKRMFATGEVKFSKEKIIHGLVQCTRDIKEADCHSCLNQALGDLRGCCYASQGGIIVSRNCNVRFELYSFYNSSGNLLKYPTSKGDKWKPWVIALVVSIPILVLTVLVVSCVVYQNLKGGQEEDEKKSQLALLQELASPKGISMTQACELMSSEELPFLDLSIIRAAANNFANANKLGQGGFGTVYKGVLPDGKEIAVKRLSKKSWQGFEEFKNEVILIAKLQHRNLVRLVGCGIEEEEKVLIYEFMPNKSLDFIIFDSERRKQLDWKTCFNIIGGIARGLLYLHEDSRLKIIHRDLKPSNVLLDHEMAAKISDFGMARIFDENQNTEKTRRVAGTYGYMSPEYAMEGLFSVKSDVFSFGVILLEILSGKQNSGFYHTELAPTLLAYAWRLWSGGKGQEFIDPMLLETSPTEEVVRCLHIGLLCIQEDPEDRPTMSFVLVLLGGESVDLPEPKPPAFSLGRIVQVDKPLRADPSMDQINSVILPR